MNPQPQGAPAPNPAPAVDNGTAMAQVINNLPPAPAPTGIDLNFADDPSNLGEITPVPQPIIPPVAQPVVAPPAPAPAPQLTPQPQPQIDPNLIPLTLPVPPAPQIPAPIPTPTPTPAPQVINPRTAPQTFDPQDWGDVQKFIQDEAQRIANETITNAVSQQEADRAAEQESMRQADFAIDTAITQLTAQGYLPPIANPNDPNDPGKLAQTELFGYAISLGTDNLNAVAPNLYALHQSGYYYDTTKGALVRKGSQTVAAQAPISGATPSITATNAPTLTMGQLANMDLRSIADVANAAIPLS
ncbi:eukaryotic translation initiation factor 3 [Caudoviricetes sp.]|nr:eukaryotic translation initiation factor 3 [Caudoviricetes sp.]